VRIRRAAILTVMLVKGRERSPMGAKGHGQAPEPSEQCPEYPYLDFDLDRLYKIRYNVR